MKLIVFDCDGTLIDSQHLIVEAMGAAFASQGLPAPDRTAVLHHVGLSLAEAMTGLTGSADEELIGKLVASYRKAFVAQRERNGFAEPMYPGAHSAILALAARDDVLLGIATGKSRRGVDFFLAREGLAGAFATIQTADTAPSKPHPAMLLQAMAETGAQPENTVMIGDSSFDMAMARAAGVTAIGVAWGYHTPRALTEAGAATVAEDYAHLLALLPAAEAAAA